MNAKTRRPLKAYESQPFLNGKDGRALRILAEYLEPKSRFDRHQVKDTIVFMGSARIRPAQAETTVPGTGDASAELARYYDAAQELARRLTLWSKALDPAHGRFVVCTGGGPGIMEAANRGAADAQGINVGLTISIPVEEFENPFITHDLGFNFHYFFMRKFWFAYLAKAVIVFPGGYGTLDELFELLTLVQTRKMRKPMPIVLFGERYWEEVINFDALVRYGTISAADVDLVFRTDSVDAAFELITRELIRNHALAQPGPTL